MNDQNNRNSDEDNNDTPSESDDVGLSIEVSAGSFKDELLPGSQETASRLIGNKRQRRETTDSFLDDVLSQICRKMKSLDTVDDSEKIAVFMEVMQCSHAESSFFLESSQWNMENAVFLYLESNQEHPFRQSARSSYNSILNDHSAPLLAPSSLASINSSSLSWYDHNIDLEISIDRLPSPWIAKIHCLTQHVYFFHPIWNIKQTEAPVEFLEAIQSYRASQTSHEDGNPMLDDRPMEQ